MLKQFLKELEPHLVSDKAVDSEMEFAREVQHEVEIADHMRRYWEE
jgi:hypothetical protein